VIFILVRVSRDCGKGQRASGLWDQNESHRVLNGMGFFCDGGCPYKSISRISLTCIIAMMDDSTGLMMESKISIACISRHSLLINSIQWMCSMTTPVSSDGLGTTFLDFWYKQYLLEHDLEPACSCWTASGVRVLVSGVIL